jgi:phospholipase C
VSLNNIDHFVVLMLENRSFDCMLGKLYPAAADFDGLTGTESNPNPPGPPVTVWNAPPNTSKDTMTIPDPDPGELWTDINFQIYGTANVPSPSPPQPPLPPMSGFVENYLAQAATAPGTYGPKSIMHYFVPTQVPVISTLAKQFAVSDRWFAAAPCQTWPNRFFVHAATAGGRQNNEPYGLLDATTIFNRFELAGNPNWKIYYGDIAQAHALSELLTLASHFHPYKAFLQDAQAGTLPSYSFIEPQYFGGLFTLPNDQHPPHDVTLGEQLIASTYNALRAGPKWTKTLLVIIYDEHGGCYDHAPPPLAKPPSPVATAPFNFDRYGVRIPAVLISPYIAQGTKLRPTGNVPYDHTSVIATLRKRFPALGGPLTDRDASAPTFDNALTLAAPTNVGPPKVQVVQPVHPTPLDLAAAQAMPVNDMQRALVHLAASLPSTAGADFQAAAKSRLLQLRAAAAQPLVPAMGTLDVGSAAAFVRKKRDDFFSGLHQP